jgi:hypothetical protein
MPPEFLAFHLDLHREWEAFGPFFPIRRYFYLPSPQYVASMQPPPRFWWNENVN